MLSIVDLLNRETMSLSMAASFLVAIHDGYSFLCCALDGGVGKTALMGALLALVPPWEEILTVTSPDKIQSFKEQEHQGTNTSRKTFLVHEIGKGQWYGYLWGKPVVEFMDLKNNTCRLAATIHADTMDQVTRQLASFEASDDDIMAFDLILFINTTSDHVLGYRRRVLTQVHVKNQGENLGCHRLLYSFHDGNFQEHGPAERFKDDDRFIIARDALHELVEEGVQRIEAVIDSLVPLHQQLKNA
ncbi:hypothetical protein GF325_09685 [Candidatus Bathyarchaeota archaeon]|nr:hypothetical protein [Candidatus Bathyarchaeota archaeon]